MQGLDKIFVDAHHAASGFGFNSFPSLGIKNLQTHRESVIHVRGRDDKNMGCAGRDTDLTDAGLRLAFRKIAREFCTRHHLHPEISEYGLDGRTDLQPKRARRHVRG